MNAKANVKTMTQKQALKAFEGANQALGKRLHELEAQLELRRQCEGRMQQQVCGAAEAPTARPPQQPTTAVLVGRIEDLAAGIAQRLLTLNGVLTAAGQNGAAGSTPAPAGLNDRLMLCIEALDHSHDVLSRTGHYLGIDC